MFGKRRQRKRMARPRADDQNRISARTARSSQTPYQCYIAPRQPRSAGGKQNAAKYRFSAALCRLYARPATRQIGANRKRYSARTLRIPQLPMIAPAPSSFLLRKPRTSRLPASPLLPQRQKHLRLTATLCGLARLFLSASECTSAKTKC